MWVFFTALSFLWSLYLCTIGSAGLSHYFFMACSRRGESDFRPKSLQKMYVCLVDVFHISNWVTKCVSVVLILVPGLTDTRQGWYLTLKRIQECSLFMRGKLNPCLTLYCGDFPVMQYPIKGTQLYLSSSEMASKSSSVAKKEVSNRQNDKNLCVSDQVYLWSYMSFADSDKYFSGCCDFICRPYTCLWWPGGILY